MGLSRQLRGDEGSKPQVYKDTKGLWTIGIGRLVDPSVAGSGLRPDEIEYLFANDMKDRVDALTKRLPWFGKLDEARQGVLLNMSFQLGVSGLLLFANTLRMIEAGNYEAASLAMLQSTWATQTPERAKRLSAQMKTGEWQYTPGT